LNFERLTERLETLREHLATKFGDDGLPRQTVQTSVSEELDRVVYGLDCVIQQIDHLVVAANATERRVSKTLLGDGHTTIFALAGVESDAHNFDCWLNGLHQSDSSYSVDIPTKTLRTYFGVVPTSGCVIELKYSTEIAKT
jgi:hypothetical protein